MKIIKISVIALLMLSVIVIVPKKSVSAADVDLYIPASGKVTCRIGRTDCLGGSYPYFDGYHRGIDIASYRGTTVYSITNGRVVYAGKKSGSESGFGNVVDIIHTINGQAYHTRYAHLSAVYVKTGDIVSGGQRIAAMGSSGTQANHLHVEMTKGTVYNYSNLSLKVPLTAFIKDPELALFKVVVGGKRIAGTGTSTTKPVPNILPNPNNLAPTSRVWVTPTSSGDTGYILNGPNTNAKIWEWDSNGNKVTSLPKYKKVLIQYTIPGVYGAMIGNVSYGKVEAILDATGNILNVPANKSYFVVMSKNGTSTIKAESVFPNPGNLANVPAKWMRPKASSSVTGYILNGPNTNSKVYEWDGNGNKQASLPKFKEVYVTQELVGYYGSGIGMVEYAKVSKIVDASGKLVDVSAKNYFVVSSLGNVPVFNQADFSTTLPPSSSNLSTIGRTWMTPLAAGDTGYILNGPNTNTKVYEWDSNGNKVPSLPKFKSILVEKVIPGTYGSMIGNVSYAKVSAIKDATGKIIPLSADKQYFMVYSKNNDLVVNMTSELPDPSNLKTVAGKWLTPKEVSNETGYILNGPNTNAKVLEWTGNGNTETKLPKFTKVYVTQVIMGTYGSMIGDVSYAKVSKYIDATGKTIDVSSQNYFVIRVQDDVSVFNESTTP